MNQFYLPSKIKISKRSFSSAELRKIIFFLAYISLFASQSSFAGQGIHGAKTVFTSNGILNEFTTLTANANTGATSLTVAASALNTNLRFGGNLVAGELVLVIQMQGASMTTTGLTNSSAWG